MVFLPNSTANTTLCCWYLEVKTNEALFSLYFLEILKGESLTPLALKDYVARKGVFLVGVIEKT